MINIPGTITITTDMNTVMNSLGTHQIILIGERIDPMFSQSISASTGNTLMPSYQAMMTLFDTQDVATFVNMYNFSLASPQADAYLAILIKAIMNGKHLLLFMSHDEYEMYFKYLSNYIQSIFGIQIMDYNTNTPFMINQNMVPNMINSLYVNELISLQDFITLYPSGAMLFNDTVVNKMIYEMQPSLGIPNPTFEDFRLYMFNYKENIKNGGQFKQSLFRKV